MNPKWLKLAGEMLELAADHFGNHGCNDWKWPADWTLEERREFSTLMEHWNVGSRPLTKDELEDVDNRAKGEYGPADFAVMGFLAAQLTLPVSRRL